MTAIAAPSGDDDRPYLGLRSYEESDAKRFFGREEQVEELVRMVRRRALTVLFGVSGIGKSSLIQAGLFPVIRAESYLPILVRLDFSGTEHDLGVQVRHAIARELEARQVEAAAPPAGVSLWRYFATTPLWSARNRLLIPLLVFDQFEEMFTLGRDFARQAEALMVELAELVERRPTVTELAELIAPGDAGADRDFVCPDPRVMLSVREDFLAHLEDARRHLPSLATNRYRLTRMRGTQALRAVQQPSAAAVSDDTARRIVEFVAAGGESPEAPPGGPNSAALEALEVEPTLLSLVCDELDRRRRELRLPRITDELIARQGGRIVERFYDRAFDGLRDAMRSLVEEKLVTGDGCRTTMARAAALELPGVTDEGIACLIDRRVLRTETRFGAAHIELIHDRLTRVASEGHARRRQARRIRRALIAVIGAPLMIIGAVVFILIWRFDRYVQHEQARASEQEKRAIAIESATLWRDEGRDALMRGDPGHALDLLQRAADRWRLARALRPSSDDWMMEHQLLAKRALLGVAGRATADHGSDLACVRLRDRDTLVTCGRDGAVRQWSQLHGGAGSRAFKAGPTSSPIQLALPSPAGWALIVRDSGAVEVTAADRDALAQLTAHTAAGEPHGATASALPLVLAPAVQVRPASSQSVAWRACIARDEGSFAVWAPDIPGIRAWVDGKRTSVLPFDDILQLSHVRCLARGKLLLALPAFDRSRDDLVVVVSREPQKVTVLKLPRASRITQLSGSADGRVVAAAVEPAGRNPDGARDIYVWNGANDPVPLAVPRGTIENLAVSDDGEQILATIHPSGDRTLVAVWKTYDGSLAFAVPRTAAAARWLPDGKGVAIVSSNRTIEAWEVASQRRVATTRLDDDIDLARVDADGDLLDIAGTFPSYTVAS
ncbi:MAG TPA: AAA family ATPase, partial [Kofleriaceae bacterium]